MRYIVSAETDVGTKRINQDSVLVKHATIADKEVLFVAICDGLGGLKMGEVASGTVVNAFSTWFEESLPYEFGSEINFDIIERKWELLLRELNGSILEYGKENDTVLGTTFSGILFIDQQYLFIHVGDTRIYHIDPRGHVYQLTLDHTFVAREVARGNMTEDQARTDRRKNTLLQCVGATELLRPQKEQGVVKAGSYLLCSDGFRHEISEAEISEHFRNDVLWDKETMHRNSRLLIDRAMQRGEKDNISVVAIKVN